MWSILKTMRVIILIDIDIMIMILAHKKTKSGFKLMMIFLQYKLNVSYEVI